MSKNKNFLNRRLSVQKGLFDNEIAEELLDINMNLGKNNE